MPTTNQPRRRKRKAEEMFPLIREWERSSLSQKEFYTRHGIKPHVFGYWLRRSRAEEEPAPQAAGGFVSIEMADEPPAEQLNLFFQHDHQGSEEKTVLQAIKAHSRVKGKPKRIKLPGGLPVFAIQVEPHPDDIKGWVKIGEEITEELDYQPGYLRINRYIRPKYARPKKEQTPKTEGNNIVIAALPSRVIDKGIPSAGLLTYLMVSKFVDHLPYHRILQIFKPSIALKPPPHPVHPVS